MRGWRWGRWSRRRRRRGREVSQGAEPCFGGLKRGQVRWLQCCPLAPLAEESHRRTLTLPTLTLRALTLHTLTLHALTLHALTVHSLTLHTLTLGTLIQHALTLGTLPNPARPNPNAPLPSSPPRPPSSGWSEGNTAERSRTAREEPSVQFLGRGARGALRSRRWVGQHSTAPTGTVLLGARASIRLAQNAASRCLNGI
jgi:hypothetical protein